jgi:hypothetical protein
VYPETAPFKSTRTSGPGPPRQVFVDGVADRVPGERFLLAGAKRQFFVAGAEEAATLHNTQQGTVTLLSL